MPRAHEKPMTKILGVFETEQVKSLDRLSEVTRIPRAVFLREAVDDLLKKYKKELKGGKRK